MADLLDLVRFRLATFRLKIEDFRHVVAGENMMAAANPLVEIQAPQEPSQIGKANVRIRCSSQNLMQQFRVWHRKRRLPDRERRSNGLQSKSPAGKGWALC